MAADRYHNEGTSDMGVIAGWRTATFGAGVVPVDTDTEYWVGGSDNVTTGVDQTGVDLAERNVTSGFTGRVGSGSSPNIVGINAAVGLGSGAFNYGAGGGVWYVKADPTNGIDIIRVDSAGKLYVVGGTINTKIDLTRGQIAIDENTVLSAKTVNSWGGEGTLDYKADGTPPTINIYGGSWLIRRRCTLNLKGGSVLLQVEKSTSDSTITQDGGYLDIRAGGIALTGNGGKATFANAIKPIAISAATISGSYDVQEKQGRVGALVTWPATITFTGVAIPSGFAKA